MSEDEVSFVGKSQKISLQLSARNTSEEISISAVALHEDAVVYVFVDDDVEMAKA